jgi:hypothetical protein
MNGQQPTSQLFGLEDLQFPLTRRLGVPQIVWKFRGDERNF